MGFYTRHYEQMVAEQCPTWSTDDLREFIATEDTPERLSCYAGPAYDLARTLLAQREGATPPA